MKNDISNQNSKICDEECQDKNIRNGEVKKDQFCDEKKSEMQIKKEKKYFFTPKRDWILHGILCFISAPFLIAIAIWMVIAVKENTLQKWGLVLLFIFGSVVAVLMGQWYRKRVEKMDDNGNDISNQNSKEVEEKCQDKSIRDDEVKKEQFYDEKKSEIQIKWGEEENEKYYEE